MPAEKEQDYVPGSILEKAIEKKYKFTNNAGLRDWIEKEFRLAMQEEMKGNSALDRAAISKIRTQRVLNKLDGLVVPDLVEIPTAERLKVAKNLLPPAQ